MENKPRYSRVSDIIDLVVFMQSKPLGVSINDIAQRYQVSRRTAERMRDGALLAVPQIEELDNLDKYKRWGFLRGYLNEIISFTPEELANLENLKELQDKNYLEEKAILLDSTITKIKAFSRKSLNKIENELEILLQSEGYAVKQTPRYKTDTNVLAIIRNAIKQSKKISTNYNNKSRKLSPLGFIYGEKIYLIAREESKGTESYNYILYKFSDVRILDEDFEKGDFDLKEYSERSFGVYQGEIYNVELLFSKEVASEVLSYFFHPTQKILQNKDGSVTVKFKASGNQEIIWHLFKWGKNIEILSPEKLKKEYIEMLQSIIKKQTEK